LGGCAGSSKIKVSVRGVRQAHMLQKEHDGPEAKKIKPVGSGGGLAPASSRTLARFGINKVTSFDGKKGSQN